MPGTVRLFRVNEWNYPKLSAKLRSSLARTVRIHSLRVSADIRASFRAPKTGRIYYYNGRRYQASAPGEPPAIRSGDLYRNVSPIFSQGGLQARIDPSQNDIFYAPWLEEGTTRMEPRPYLNRAFNRRRQAFLKDVRTQLAKAFG